MSKYDYLEYMYQIDELREKSLYDAYYTARWPKTNPAIKNLNVSKEDLKALNDTVFKEEKKMHKKRKIKGHVAHKMIVKGRTYFYIVAPERESLEVYAEWSQPPIGYAQVDSIHITPRMLGRHGYLQSVIKRLAEYLSGDYTVVYCQNDVSVTEKAFKLISNEEKKMHKKTKVNGHVLHKLPECDNLYYTVEPEHGCIAVYRLKPDEINGGLCYAEFEDIAIHTAQLGRPGYLQEQIELISKKHFKEEKKMNTTNIRHFVLVAKTTLSNDQALYDCEYMQVVQQGDRFMLLFDSADITQTEVADLTKYLSGVLSIKDVSLSVDPEFMNYAISFTDNSSLGVDPIQNLCSILADGAKYKRTYPFRARHKATSSISSISFSIQENGDTPIFKQRWREGLNGYVSIKARVYNENGVDVRPYKPLDSDILRFYVRNGRVWLLRYPTTVLETMGAIPETWSKCPQILTTEYRDEDHLIMDCRVVLEHFGMYRNASTVKLCWYPTVNGI